MPLGGEYGPIKNTGRLFFLSFRYAAADGKKRVFFILSFI